MGHSTGDRSEILFRRLLLISLLSYFILAIGIELVPYTPDIEKIKSLRTVRLKETPLKGPLPVPIPAKPKEKEQRIEDLKKQQEAEKKKLAEDQKKMEEAQRLAEERKRQEEERRKEEELRRAEEERRLTKERNREAARNSGLLKAMKGEKRSLENIMSNEEMRNVLSETKLKSSKAQQEMTQANKTDRQKRVIKGSEGIGNVAGALPKTPSGSLSGQKRITGVEMEHTGREGIGTGGKPGVRKTRSQESIKEVVNARRGGIDFLYKKALRSNPTLKGVIVIEFTITPDGDVLSTQMVSTTINDPSFEEEVLKRVRSWKFPPYPDSGNTVVKYPIEFYPV